MSRLIRFAVCLVALVCTLGIWSQTPAAQTDENASDAASAAVAHVYVGNSNHVYAYSAAADGKLTPVPGSPFNASLSWMGTSEHYLYGYEGTGTTIASFSMAADGALRQVATTDTGNFYSNCCGPYDSGFRIEAFRINDSNGELTFLGNTGTSWLSYPGLSSYEGTNLSILGNDKFAYLPVNFFFLPPPSARVPVPDDGGWVCEFSMYQRLSSGELVDSSATYATPAAPNNGSDAGGYCPVSAATDPTDHLAIMLDAIDGDSGNTYGPTVIASYTADANGNLTTTSTYHNMPVSEPGSGFMRMSPSGKLLAVGGSGLELFHFNGANPVTKYKMLLATESINLIYWDNNNHMYAIGSDAKGGKLWVYTVTPTSVTEAPGSPYSIANAASMAVHTLN
jgi:hypothetical protein